MKHIRSHNLATHDLFCDVVLTTYDIQLIRECVRLIEQPGDEIAITLASGRAHLSLMPDTAIPIIRAV